MKKKLFILAVVGLMVFLIGFVAIACACDGDKDKDGKSKQGHLNLYQKCRLINDIPDPNVPFCNSGSVPSDLDIIDQDLDRVPGGAWGKMKYKSSGPIFKVEFEGHRLKPGESYTLIYFPKFYTSGIGLIYFGSDIADKHGNVHIRGSLDTGNLPLPYDEDCIIDSTWRCGEGSGARIWLVLSSDVCIRLSDRSPRMIDWNPDKYLFEDELITFTNPKFDPDPTKDCAYM